MKRIAAGLLIALAACGTPPASQPATTTTAAKREPGPVDAAAVNGLTLALFGRNSGASKGNVALSGWSIATALGMTRLGAKALTATEMDKVLPTTSSALRALNAELATRDGTFDNDRSVELKASNRVFAQRGLALEPDFVGLLTRDFGSSAGLVDYKAHAEPARVEINKWVADGTKNRIKELIEKGLIDRSTRLVLVNAVYLKADWLLPFEKEQTRPASFNTPSGAVEVPFMNGEGFRHLARGPGWVAVELSYAGEKLAMDVVVPDSGRFDEVASRVAPELFAAIDVAPPRGVQLSLPKFDFGKSLALKGDLRALGMPTAFGDAADFSGMTKEEQLLISEVVHQANITVDEKGTVAAAATGVVMRATAAMQTESLIVDRPFLFFLRDIPTGAILFAGQVTNPSKQ